MRRLLEARAQMMAPPETAVAALAVVTVLVLMAALAVATDQ